MYYISVSIEFIPVKDTGYICILDCSSYKIHTEKKILSPFLVFYVSFSPPTYLNNKLKIPQKDSSSVQHTCTVITEFDIANE